MTQPGGIRGSLRLDVDGDDLGRGFGQVVLAVAEILRELLERQTIRRIDAGDLGVDEIERLGVALMHMREQLAELRELLVPSTPRRHVS
jgi:hypothetical protein